ncbi:hypothetical protein [Rhodococcus spongiicola]|uniref:Uncharacterized protein n=1 Tax=Rhodococcus spongiicola TaxID=2487352 RepID=A0A438AQF6_9NOCA|nr:hypothetical protein [Rhodococcus spongiicola]RVW00895.1 hypothetical protein EF834_16040 [Rhodococcus spongiicola]
MKNALVWIGALVVLAFVLSYWKWMVAAAVITGLALAWSKFVASFRRRRQKAALDRWNGEVALRSTLAARANAQHQQ